MVNDKLLGSQLGSYILVDVLGHGAFGSVYLGKHFLLEHKPPVAVKVLNTTLNTQEEIDRFFQEAVILDKLTHPNILPVVDANLYESYPFFVAEYAPGGSLRDRLDKFSSNTMNLTDTMHLLNQVGLALQHAHDLDIVHRDLKPANILFNAEGDALLADFGIAIQLQKTRRVDEIGTPPYMSPEQFKGKVSKKSDQYALACIAYELLTGQQLFTADDPYTIGYKHIYEPPVEPRELNPDIPEAIEVVILKALSKERDDRYESVADFIQALRAGAGLPISTSTPLPPSRSTAMPEIQPAEAPDTDLWDVDPEVPARAIPRMKRASQASDPHQTQLTPPTPTHSTGGNVAHSTGGNTVHTLLVWSVATGFDHTYYSEPTVLNGVVYAGTYTTIVDNPNKEANQLRALDATTGQQIWAVNTEYGIYDAPVVANNVVYVCTGNINRPGKIYAVEATTGQVRWSFPTEEYIKVRPTITNDIVYAYPEHGIYALDADSGRECWSVTIKAGMSNRPVIASGTMYLTTDRGYCYELDALTGQKLDTFTDMGDVHAAETTVDGVNCICSFENELYSIDMSAQQIRWSIQLDKHVSGDLVLKNGIAYIGSHGGFVGDSANTKLHAIDASTGKILWVAHLKHEIESAPVVADNIICVSTFGRELYGLDLKNGHILFVAKVGKGRINRPSIENNLVAVSTGEMHALQLK
jgi:eukaryotic-like serine/threonine-protein kinase